MAERSTRATQRRYPPEPRKRTVRMVLEIASKRGERFGAVSRVARGLGVGPESQRSGFLGAGQLGSFADRAWGVSLIARSVGLPATSDALMTHEGDALDLNEQPLKEPYADCRARGGVSREVLSIDPVELIEISRRIRKKCVDLDDVFEPRTARAQDRFDVLQALARLVCDAPLDYDPNQR